jgi:hypothetical protein
MSGGPPRITARRERLCPRDEGGGLAPTALNYSNRDSSGGDLGGVRLSQIATVVDQASRLSDASANQLQPWLVSRGSKERLHNCIFAAGRYTPPQTRRIPAKLLRFDSISCGAPSMTNAWDGESMKSAVRA